MAGVECVIEELDDNNNTVYVDEISALLDSNEYAAQEGEEFLLSGSEYEANYSKVELILIARYYGIAIRRLSKHELARSIAAFEINSENGERVAARFAAWEALEVLRADPFMASNVLL